MRRRRWAGAADVFVEIVDAAVIDQIASAVKHRRLWRYARVPQLDQGVGGIAQCWQSVGKVVQILPNFVRRLGCVREYQEKLRVAAVLRAEVLNRRRVAARDRTILADEDQDYAPSGCGCEGVEWLALEVERGGSFLRCVQPGYECKRQQSLKKIPTAKPGKGIAHGNGSANRKS